MPNYLEVSDYQIINLSCPTLYIFLPIFREMLIEILEIKFQKIHMKTKQNIFMPVIVKHKH